MKLAGVLLDVDGTLIDSNPAHARAWVDALTEFGYEATVDRMIRLIGMGGDKILPKVTGLDPQSEKAKELTARRMEIFSTKYLPTLRAFPGAHELLARFTADGLRTVVATSAKSDELNALLEQTGLEELIDRKTSSSDADRSKPDPDIITAALQRGQLARERVLMLGDTPYDVEAARAARIRTVALRCGGWNDDALSGALAIYDDPRALLVAYERSPFRR